MISFPTPYGPLSLYWRFTTLSFSPKTLIAIIPGTGKVTDFKFDRYIHRVHPNKSQLKTLEKRAWAYPRAANFGGTPIIYYLSSQERTGKATNFKFCTHIHKTDRNKKPIKMSGKVALGLPKNFTTPIYRAHRAVIFATAQLSC